MDKEPGAFDYYDDLFDQYVETENLEFSDNDADRSSSDDLGNYFDLADSLPCTAACAFPFPQKFYLGSCSRTSLSEPNLLSLDYLFSSQNVFGPPTTPNPSSPSTTISKQDFANISARTRGSASCGIRKGNWHSSMSSNMSQPTSSRRTNHGRWDRKIDASANDFNHQAYYSNQPLSPVSTGRHARWHHENLLAAQNANASVSWNRHTSWQDIISPSTNTFPNQYTPATSPSLAQRNHFIQSPTSAPYYPSTFPDSLDTFTSPHLKQDILWEHDAPPDFVFGSSPGFNDATVQPWCPPSQSREVSYMQNLACTEPRYTANPHTMSVMPLTPNTSKYPSLQGYPSTTTSQSENSQVVVPGSPSRCRPQQSKYSRASRSPSPTPTTPHSNRVSRYHRRSKTSTSSSRPASAGFVNFTPEDSRQILKGVAPSGSSKTKARREKEQAEKRRRLSQAATKAIMDVGGDLGELEREGLLV